jgi:uncharacterized membrane protein
VKRFIQNWGLAAAVAVGLILRFWNLDLKPLWLDETITLLSMGHRYDDIPLGTLLPLPDLIDGLAWQPQSCSVIAQSVNEQSTHPPLFFCVMHQWLGSVKNSGHSLLWQVRSLPALFGVGAIAAVYGLNRITFSRTAGVWAAGLMAVSPFAVYLSQEARHYTLPMLVITLSLIPFVQICNEPRVRQPWLWLAWVSLNSLGFYIHYFCVLAFVGQVLTLFIFIVRRRQWQQTVDLTISIGLFGLSLLPWLPFLLGHTQRPETEWLRFGGGGILDYLGPIARLLAGVIVTVVMLPVEEQSLTITIGNGVLMLAIASYLGVTLWNTRKNLTPKTTSGVNILGLYLLVLCAEYLLLVYGVHKDLTLAFRYNFVFYPAFCGLLAALLAESTNPFHRRVLWMLIAVGIVSTGFVVTDAAFAKPFRPGAIAQEVLQDSGPEFVVLKQYQGWQDVALGLSNAFALQRLRGQSPTVSTNIQWGFIKVGEGIKVEPNFGLQPPFKLWRMGALHQKNSDSTTLSFPVSQKLTHPTVIHCDALQAARQDMGVQYQPFQCRLKND